MASASFQRRDTLAREQGFKSYGEKRKVLKYAKESENFRDALALEPDEVRGDNPEVRNMAKLYHEAFKVHPDDYSADSPKAKWFVGVEHLMTYEEWRDHYPRGLREYHRSHFAA